jgi:hypothetical protein
MNEYKALVRRYGEDAARRIAGLEETEHALLEKVQELEAGLEHVRSAVAIRVEALESGNARLRDVLDALISCAERVARTKGYLKIQDATALGRAFRQMERAVRLAREALQAPELGASSPGSRAGSDHEKAGRTGAHGEASPGHPGGVTWVK